MSIKTLQPMKALTVHQPWAWAIAVGLKPIENRTWAPRGQLSPGDRFAIHAGRARGELGDLAFVRELAVRVGRGAEVPRDLDDPRLVRGAVVAVATYGGVVTNQAAADLVRPGAGEWYAGEVGWVLRDVVPLWQPIGCRGFQGLWELDGETLFQVVEQLEGRAR